MDQLSTKSMTLPEHEDPSMVIVTSTQDKSPPLDQPVTSSKDSAIYTAKGSSTAEDQDTTSEMLPATESEDASGSTKVAEKDDASEVNVAFSSDPEKVPESIKKERPDNQHLNMNLTREISTIAIEGEEKSSKTKIVECTCSENDPPPGRFVYFIVNYPYVPLLVTIVLIGAAIGVSCRWYPLPDFKDPTKGFQTRGTHIVSRARTLANLEHQFLSPYDNSTRYYRSPNNKQWRGALYNVTSTNMAQLKGRNRRYTECKPRNIRIDSTKFVLEPTHKDVDLFSVPGLRDMCAFSAQLIQPYLPLRCPAKSLAHAVATLRNKHCSQIVESDVVYAKALLDRCVPLYLNGSLRGSTREGDCAEDGFVYNVMHYLTDKQFGAKSRLRYVLLYAETVGDSKVERKYYERHLVGRRLQQGNVRLAAVALRFQKLVKNAVFSDYVISDLKYFVVAMALMSVLMYIYLRSFALLIATFLNVIFSFALAYFIYAFIFRLKFFPFINLLAGLLLIAVGADDVFIFHDAWVHARCGSCPLHGRSIALAHAYSHAGVSIVVTSLTTAAAFFVNFVSTITAIRCFSVFAGLAMMTNLCVMLIWTPAVIAALDACSMRLRPFPISRLFTAYDKIVSRPCQGVHWLFTHLIPTIIYRARFVLIVTFIGAGIGAAVIVFASPGLHLPSSSRFQLFESSNLLERWDQGLRREFRAIIESDAHVARRLHVFYVFGFLPKDSGSWLVPSGESAHADLQENDAFDIFSEANQLWMLQFCRTLKSQPFVAVYGRYSTCGFDAYSRALADICPYANTTIRSSPLARCCARRTPPFEPDILRYCTPLLHYYISRYPLSSSKQPEMMFGGPVFNASNDVRGYFFSVRTDLTYTLSYADMRRHYETLQVFMQRNLVDAPAGMRSGFYSAGDGFLFYDLQAALARGTYTSVGLSLAVAFLMMLLTTFNPIITLLAIFTISLVILFTVAAIVLIGWSLNIVESIIISLVVGLSIDFTIHYGVAYRQSSATSSRGRVSHSLARVGVAVITAAMTTFTSGAAMLPCVVLVYRQLGVFLMIVMAFSWLLATFFFQPLCLVVSPHRCQILPRCRRSPKAYQVDSP